MRFREDEGRIGEKEGRWRVYRSLVVNSVEKKT